jgi:hypothetical protein
MNVPAALAGQTHFSITKFRHLDVDDDDATSITLTIYISFVQNLPFLLSAALSFLQVPSRSLFGYFEIFRNLLARQPSFAPPASDCIFTDTRSLRHSGKIIPSFLFPNLHSTSCLFRIVVGFFYIVCILLHIIFSFFLPSFYCSFFFTPQCLFLVYLFNYLYL